MLSCFSGKIRRKKNYLIAVDFCLEHAKVNTLKFIYMYIYLDRFV